MPAPTVRRLWGFIDDTGSGGTSYDSLAAGGGGSEPKDIPNATSFFPVTGGTIDYNIERIDRNEEVRGRRPNTAPLPFRAAPMATIPVPAYRSVVEKVFKKVMGGTDTVTGSASPFTHTIAAVGFGANVMPAIHSQMVRDDLNQKMAGGVVNRATFNFPLDGQGTVEIELWGKYIQHFAAAPPTSSGLPTGSIMLLRDAAVFVDGSSTAIDNLEGFEFTWVNNAVRHWYAKKNVSALVLGTPATTYKVWWPEENRIGAAQDITFAINLGATSILQELAMQYAQVEKFVFEVTGDPITGGSETLRITIYGGNLNSGGAEALSARDDITSRFEGGAFYSTADSADVKVEILSSTNTPIT